MVCKHFYKIICIFTSFRKSCSDLYIYCRFVYKQFRINRRWCSWQMHHGLSHSPASTKLSPSKVLVWLSVGLSDELPMLEIIIVLGWVVYFNVGSQYKWTDHICFFRCLLSFKLYWNPSCSYTENPQSGARSCNETNKIFPCKFEAKPWQCLLSGMRLSKHLLLLV